MTQDSIDPLQETRMLAAAALLEKETEDSDEMYKDLFPRLLSAEDEASQDNESRDDQATTVAGKSLVPVPEGRVAGLAAFDEGKWNEDYPEVPQLALPKAKDGFDALENGGRVDVASSTPLKEQWRTYHTEGKLMSWKKKCGR